MAIDKDLLDRLLAGRDAWELFGSGGLLDELKKALSERILSAELDDHLAHGEALERGNRRNGTSKKTVLSGTSQVTLDIPRDRAGTFDPKLENFDYFGFVVERRIVHDHQTARPEHGQQHFFDPHCHGQVGAACVEQQANGQASPYQSPSHRASSPNPMAMHKIPDSPAESARYKPALVSLQRQAQTPDQPDRRNHLRLSVLPTPGARRISAAGRPASAALPEIPQHQEPKIPQQSETSHPQTTAAAEPDHSGSPHADNHP